MDAVTARQARLRGAVPVAGQWLEVTGPAPVSPLRLTKAVVADAGDYAGWLVVLGAVAGGDGGDLVPILTGGAVVLAGADGVLDPYGPGSSPRVVAEPGETAGQALARVLETEGHALRLRQLFAAVAGRSLTGSAALEVTWQSRAAALTTDGCGAAGALVEIDPAAGLRPCDQLWLAFRNISGKAVDVSILYLSLIHI